MDENDRAMLERLEALLGLARQSGITTPNQPAPTTSTHPVSDPSTSTAPTTSTAPSRSSEILSELSRIGSNASTQFLVFPISTRVDITVYQHGKCFIFLK